MKDNKRIKSFGNFLGQFSIFIIIISMIALFVLSQLVQANELTFNWNWLWLLLLVLPITEIFYYYGVTQDMFDMRGKLKDEELHSLSFLAGVKFFSFVTAYTALFLLGTIIAMAAGIVYLGYNLFKVITDAILTSSASDWKGIGIFAAVIIVIIAFVWINAALGRSWLKRDK